jgi:hypothetical protein
MNKKYDNNEIIIASRAYFLQKAQELFDKRQAEAESREKNLQQRLQTALDSLRGKPHSLFNLGFARIASVC